MTDFHAHFLPGIDDGADSLEESVQILLESSRQGVSRIYATPHFYADEDDPSSFLRRRNAAYRSLCDFLQQAVPGAEIPELCLGAEVYYFPGMADCEEMTSLAMGNTGTILIEPPMVPWTDYMLDEIEAVSSGLRLTPVIAHADRYFRVLRDASLFDRLDGRDMLVQVNASFFIREQHRDYALSLLSEGRIHMIGSDVHNTETRRQDLGFAVKEITKKSQELLAILRE